MNFTKLTKEEQLTILANVAEDKGIVDNAVEKDYYNRGIQMYRFPNSDVQKSVIFEGIKKRLKIV